MAEASEQKPPDDPEAHDEFWMRRAIAQARLAADRGEVPIGAVLVAEGNQLLAAAHDRKEVTHDPTAHAEIEVIRQASFLNSDWRLNHVPSKSEDSPHQYRDISLYVTLEPCVMCFGAILQARISRLVFGAKNRRWSLKDETLNEMLAGHQFNHALEWKGGVLEEECAGILRNVFRKYRQNRN